MPTSIPPSIPRSKPRHRDTYLSIVLTVTTCLLTVDLWTRLIDRPVLADAAHAQVRSANRNARTPNKGVGSAQTDAVAQRKVMVELLKGINAELAGLRSDFKTTTFKVEVVNTGQPKR